MVQFSECFICRYANRVVMDSNFIESLLKRINRAFLNADKGALL